MKTQSLVNDNNVPIAGGNAIKQCFLNKVVSIIIIGSSIEHFDIMEVVNKTFVLFNVIAICKKGL